MTKLFTSLLKTIRKRHKHPLLIFALGTFLFWYFVKTKEQILGYPGFLIVITFAPLFAICIGVSAIERKTQFRKAKKLDRYLITGFILAGNALLAYMISGALLIVFNAININFSEQNSSEPIICPVTSAYSDHRTSTIYYSFRQKEYALNDSSELVYNIYKHKSAGKYNIVFSARKGLLSTYVIEYWKIMPK